MIELERTFLLKKMPEDLDKLPKKEMIDVYIPPSAEHPCLRLRKNGNSFELTKKCPINDSDASKQRESTIILTEEEFLALQKVEGKIVKKLRYDHVWENRKCEIDIFQDKLAGLGLIDFEFDNLM